MKPKTKVVELPPWSLPIEELNGYTAEIAAIRALGDGTADEYQQRAALEFICKRLCGEGTMSFWPGAEDGRRATDFAEGRQWPAIQLRRILKLEPVRISARDEPPAMPKSEPTR